MKTSTEATKRHVRAILLGALWIAILGMLPAHATFALEADGRFDPDEGYTVMHWITFPQAGQNGEQSGWAGASGVGKAFLALGTDESGNHFLYVALPKGYVDNTFLSDPTQSIPPVVGTYNGGGGHQIGDGLIGSDQFGITGTATTFNLQFLDPDGTGIPTDAAGDWGYRMTVDYLADWKYMGDRIDIRSSGVKEATAPDVPPEGYQWDRRDGSLIKGNLDNILNIATSMEWNIDTFGPTGTGDISEEDIRTLSGILASSPDVVRQVGGPDDGLAILAADGYSYQPADADFADWIYEVAYEFELDSSLFGEEWADPTTDPTTLLRLGNAHASPYKGLNGQKDLEDPAFAFECTGEAFIIQTNEGQLIQVDQSVDPFEFNEFAGGPAGFEINNIGFRKADGLIYGWRRCGTQVTPPPNQTFNCELDQQEIVAIDANHSIISLGRGGLPDPTTENRMRFFSGDVSPDSSKFYLNWNGGGKIYTVTLPALTVAAEPSITIKPLNYDPENPDLYPPKICTTSSTAGDCGRVADWAAHPTNGLLYGGNDTNKKVAILDPVTGDRRDWGVTCTGGSDCLGTSSNGFGAAWFNAAGNLFLYNNDGTIYEVANVGDCTPYDDDCNAPPAPRLVMEVVSVQENGPSSTFNDGAACLVDEDEEEPILPLRAEKTAAGSYDRTIEWTLDKSVDVDSHTGFAGQAAGTSNWTVVADKTETLGNFQVTGFITVYNENAFEVPVTVSDVLSDGTVASVDCPSNTVPGAVLNGELTPGQLTCTYVASPANGSATLNTATITSAFTDVEGATATATIGWSEGNTFGYDLGTLSDDNPNNPNDPTVISDDTTWNYSQAFTCPKDLGLYDANGKHSFTVDNTATLNGDINLSDTESVTVDCYIPLISKTANGSYDQTHTWDVEKSVDPESQSGFAGDTLDWTWTVNVSETSADSNFGVSGVITLTNPNPVDVMEIVVTDTLDGNPLSTIGLASNPATNCNLAAANGVTWTLGAGETGTCNYASTVTWQDWADVPTRNDVTAFLNFGTPELVGVKYAARPIEWTANVINGTATVDDDHEPDLPETLTAGQGPWQWTETQEHSCSGDVADYAADGTYSETRDNTATVTGSNGQSDSASADTTYACYAPVVSKDASASYDERHTWDVEKSVDPASQSGDPGDTLQWTWTVDVSESSVDENFSVTGSISVANPAGSPGNMTVSLVDQLNDGTSATVDCGGDATSVTVAPGTTETCSYSASPPDHTATSNTATGTFSGIDFTATAAVNFVKNVVNGTADIDDDQESAFPLTLTAGEGLWSWTETQDHTCSTDIADYVADGTYSDTRYNTATVTGSDGQSDSASAATTYTCEAGTIDVQKYTDGVVNDTYDWRFALYIGPDGFGGTPVGNADSTLDDSDGVLDFGDPVPALSPDTTYTVCELTVPAGWATEWNIDGVIMIPYNPDVDNSPPEDLGNRCFDVGAGTSYPVTVGQNLRITVDNTFPGGDPRTPGYWKNWSSCTDGGQFEKTTDDVDPDNEYVSLDEVLNDPGVNWCDFTIDSCVDAVSILDQRDIASGKKLSSDSAYTLAMHLLAAELNYGAGAESCELASDAILYARNLLCQLDFVGTGSYLRPKGRTYEDYYYALDLKDLLDDYNNGRLCGEEIATDFPPHVSIDEPAEGDVIGDGGDNPVASIIVDASTSDDHGVIQVEFFVDGVFIGADLDDSDSFWSTAWDLSGVADGIHSITATATDTIGQTSSDSIEVTVDNETGDPMHVGDLDAATVAGKGGKWDATVTVEVHDHLDALVIGATVDGTWSDGTAGSCTTDGSGQCTVTRSNGRKVSTVTFRVDSVSAAGYDYAAAHNHDPDGDSDGTSIVIVTP